MALYLRYIVNVLLLLIALGAPLDGASGKLDFGDEEKPPTTVDLKNVSCDSGGCNSTSNNNSVETQILVHIHTKLNLEQKQLKVDDVPVVEGRRSSGYLVDAELRNNDNYPSSTFRPYFPRRDFDYNNNNNRPMELPYLENTYNRHYFREEPPPNIWLSRGNGYNPVEFKNNPRETWKPLFRNKYEFIENGNRPSNYYYQPNKGCSCNDDVSASTLHHRIARPQSHIDDKLGRFN